MSKKITDTQIAELAQKNGWEYAALKAIISVESGGIGFDPKTDKVIIQFEPSWFARKAPGVRKTGIWDTNKVEGQNREWIAFNDAFNINPQAAMESTSVGMMQVMGFHWKALSFKSVGEMWDYARQSEMNQVEIAIRFIKLNPKLAAAVKGKNWPVVAYYYNGAGYKKFNYDNRLAAAYQAALKATNI